MCLCGGKSENYIIWNEFFHTCCVNTKCRFVSIQFRFRNQFYTHFRRYVNSMACYFDHCTFCMDKSLRLPHIHVNVKIYLECGIYRSFCMLVNKWIEPLDMCLAPLWHATPISHIYTIHTIAAA